MRKNDQRISETIRFFINSYPKRREREPFYEKDDWIM